MKKTIALTIVAFLVIALFISQYKRMNSMFDGGPQETPSESNQL